MPRQEAAINRIVQYRLGMGRQPGEYRPAMIVAVHAPDEQHPSGSVGLSIFTDHTNDGLPLVMWGDHIVEGTNEGEYRWPPMPVVVPPVGTTATQE